MPPKLSNTKGVTWLNHEVNELLNVWAEDGIQEQLAGRLHNQCVYGKISDRLRVRGIVRSAEQCREKIKKLKRDYRAIVDNNYAPAFARKLLSCYDKMHSVLGARAITRPQSLLESLNVTTKSNLSAGSSESSRTPPKEDESVSERNGLVRSSSRFNLVPPSKRQDKEPNVVNLISPLSEVMATLITEKTERQSENEDDTPSSEDDDESESKQRSEQPDRAYKTGSDVTSEVGAASAGEASGSNSESNLMQGSKASVASTSVDKKQVSGKNGRGETRRPNDRVYHQSLPHENKKRSRKRGYVLEEFLEKFLEMQEVLHDKFLALEEKRFKQEMEIEKRRISMEEKRREQERQQEQRLFQTLSAILTSTPEKNTAPDAEEAEKPPAATDEQSTSCFDNVEEDAPVLLGL